MEIRYAEADYGKVSVKTKQVGKPGAGQLLLKAQYSALSPGTERGLMQGVIHPLPQGIGYSMVARVAEVGEGVKDFREGDLVVATAPHAEFVIVSQNVATPVPEGIDEEQAAFYALSRTAIYGIRRTRIQLGESVVVLGQGMVGLIAGYLARLAGACPVIVTDIDDGRLDIAKKLGARNAINTMKDPDALKRTIESLGPGAPSVVLEAAGVYPTMELAFKIVGERGRVMYLSTVHADTGEHLSFGEMLVSLYMKGATYIGGYVNSKPFSLKRYDLAFTEAWPPTLSEEPSRFVSSDIWTSEEDNRTILKLIHHGVLDLRPLITHRFSVDQIPEAYDLVWKGDPALLGGLICWDKR